MRQMRFAIFTLCLLWGSPGWSDAQDARMWLHKMSDAMQHLNYEGTFVYLHEGQLESMRILHRFTEDGEQERLLSLTGTAREVIRDDKKVICILPDVKAVMVEKSRPRPLFPAPLPDDLEQLVSNYDFVLAGEGRVSSMPSRAIEIRPKDDFRYGYRLWLDKRSNLLLKSDLFDKVGSIVEQMMFTQLSVLEDLPVESLQPSLIGDNYTWVNRSSGDPQDVSTVSESLWETTWLPQGFRSTYHNQYHSRDGAEKVEHMVFSDGLASVSVYIEKSGDDKSWLSGLSQMGAVNVMGRSLNGHQITVVGEVPKVTVERIGTSIRHGQ